MGAGRGSSRFLFGAFCVVWKGRAPLRQGAPALSGQSAPTATISSRLAQLHAMMVVQCCKFDFHLLRKTNHGCAQTPTLLLVSSARQASKHKYRPCSPSRTDKRAQGRRPRFTDFTIREAVASPPAWMLPCREDRYRTFGHRLGLVAVVGTQPGSMSCRRLFKRQRSLAI